MECKQLQMNLGGSVVKSDVREFGHAVISHVNHSVYLIM